jgi:hypothetical protein
MVKLTMNKINKAKANQWINTAKLTINKVNMAKLTNEYLMIKFKMIELTMNKTNMAELTKK